MSGEADVGVLGLVEIEGIRKEAEVFRGRSMWRGRRLLPRVKSTPNVEYCQGQG